MSKSSNYVSALTHNSGLFFFFFLIDIVLYRVYAVVVVLISCDAFIFAHDVVFVIVEDSIRRWTHTHTQFTEEFDEELCKNGIAILKQL